MNTLINFNAISETIKKSPYIFAVIAVLGITQAFFVFIPDAFMLNWCLLFFLILLKAETFECAASRTKYIVYTAVPILIIINLIVHLFTDLSYVQDITVSCVILFCCCSFALFFKANENFVNELKTRIIHLLVSILFFAAVYAVVYLIAYLIDHIFNLKLEYYDSPLYRFANSVSSITGATVFASYKKKTEYRHSKFFNLMFQKLLSPLLVPLLVLAGIYFTKNIFAVENNLYSVTNIYYLFVGVFFIILAMFQINTDEPVPFKLTRLITLLAAMIPLLFSVFLITYRTSHVLYIGFTDSNTPLIHELLVNGLVSAYCFYLFFSKKKINNRLVHLALAVSLILYLPAIGYFNFSSYHTSKEIRQPVKKTAFADFKEQRADRARRYAHRFQELKYFSVSPTCHYKNTKYMQYNLNTENIRSAALGASIEWYRYPSQSRRSNMPLQYAGYEFSFDDEGRKMLVRTPAGKEFRYELYSALKQYDNMKSSQIPEIKFDESEFTVYVQWYRLRYAADSGSTDNASLEFDFFIKK